MTDSLHKIPVKEGVVDGLAIGQSHYPKVFSTFLHIDPMANPPIGEERFFVRQSLGVPSRSACGTATVA
jgi:hypothetical protein